MHGGIFLKGSVEPKEQGRDTEVIAQITTFFPSLMFQVAYLLIFSVMMFCHL